MGAPPHRPTYPSTVALADLQGIVGGKAPGWTFLARRDGFPFSDASHGDARLASSGGQFSMSERTIVHIASMSKPICVTAFVAMLEDWKSLADRLQNLAAEPTVELTFLQKFEIPVNFTPLPGRQLNIDVTESVPLVLAPIFSSTSLARKFLNAGIASILPASYTNMIQKFVDSQTPMPPLPAVPPGFVALMMRIIAGVHPPRFTDPFLPFVKGRIQQAAAARHLPYVEGQGVAAVTFDELIRHQSALPNGITDPLLFEVIPGGRDAVSYQPSDGSHATFDLWTYMFLFLSQQASGRPGYKNDDYTVLGAVVDECTGGYDDYVYARLFHDQRFSDIRRYVVDASRGAYYYDGTSPNWTGGVPLPDYRGWSAAGGFYTSAAQMTDWLEALYTGQPVLQVLGQAPLVSPAGRATLFQTTGYFSAGGIGTPAPGWSSYEHNGGTCVGGGFTNGKMGILQGPGHVLTAFFDANGHLDAEPPFNQTVADLLPLV